MQLGHGRQKVHGQLRDVQVRLAQQRRKLDKDRAQGAAVQVGGVVTELGHNKNLYYEILQGVLKPNRR